MVRMSDVDHISMKQVVQIIMERMRPIRCMISVCGGVTMGRTFPMNYLDGYFLASTGVLSTTTLEALRHTVYERMGHNRL